VVDTLAPTWPTKNAPPSRGSVCPLPTRTGNLTPSREPAARQEGRRFDHGKNAKHGRDARGRQGGVTRRAAKRRRSRQAFVSVSFRSFRGQSSSTMAWATQSTSKKTNTLEQKDTKIAKKSKAGNYFRRYQYVFQRRPEPPLEALSALSLRDLCDLLFS
jgi:hypothetical protein